MDPAGESANRDVTEGAREPQVAKTSTPRIAAIAGILFSVLMIVALVLLRLSSSPDQVARGDWMETSAPRVVVALHLIPFAGIAFLWFIGVLRDRLGASEDRFFATIFLGSGLLFLALLFVSASVLGAMLLTPREGTSLETTSPTFALAGALSVTLMNVYTLKVAGVFMISTSTLTIMTGIAPRWLAYLGYALAAVLIIGSSLTAWGFLVFPGWVLVLSGQILLDQFRRRAD